MVTFEVEQTTSHSSVDFFEMHIPVRFIGTDTDTTFVFYNTQNPQTFTCSPGFTVQEVLLDPDRWIITIDPLVTTGIEERLLSEDIRVYPNPVGEILYIDLPGSLLLTRSLSGVEGSEGRV